LVKWSPGISSVKPNNGRQEQNDERYRAGQGKPDCTLECRSRPMRAKAADGIRHLPAHRISGCRKDFLLTCEIWATGQAYPRKT
jgi:hypothetical protein